ncbi:cell envelope integrity protein TolA [Luteimonas saliphila]|uniref:cell envelope integrity protein TolA n=1 Tax=Luteimonas saliphila TaxID=2804919 RepID=UPI00192D7A92|nr:cell envelope integrity protein TolA [Luteimonas saliphila]
MHADAFPRPAHVQDEGLGRAIAWAVVVHLLVAAILLLSPLLSWDPDRISVAGAPSMEAVLDVSDAEQRAVERALAVEPEPMPAPVLPVPEPVEEDVAPPPQPIPEPVPEDAPVQPQPTPQERVPEPAPVDQDEVRRDAEAERARIDREQEEKRRQEQIDLTERKRQEEAEQKRRLAQEQLERIRAERAREERQARLAEERLKQLADREARQASQQAAAQQSSAPPPGNQGVDTGLSARYAAALQEAILRNWTRPETVPIGQRCRIVIRQIPGGEVVSAEVDPSCPYDELGRRSVEAAVLKAQPLPYVGFESVFQRTLLLNFTAQDR